MGRWRKFVALTILVLGVTLSGCGGFGPAQTLSQPTDEHAQVTAVGPSLTLVGYRYTVEDVGNGWNQGVVYLAWENRGQGLLGAETTNLSDGVVETSEGVTYPLEAGSQVPGMALIPPGFRVEAGDAAIRFRFAYAAHPTVVTFTGTDTRIDLTGLDNALPLGFIGSDRSGFRRLSDLMGHVVLDEPGKARATVGAWDCGWNWKAQLYVEIENLDLYQEASIKVSVPGVAILDGVANSLVNEREYSVGPGQKVSNLYFEGHIMSAQVCQNDPFLVLYGESPSEYSVYSLQ